MPGVPWWAVCSAAALPVLLVIGWITAAVRQPPGYDPFAETLSSLSVYGTVDRQILVGCLAALGVAHLVTAIGLRPVRLAGRLVYGLGGLATVLVAAVPKLDSATPPAHGISAVIAFVALAAWPAAATLPVPRRRSPVRAGHPVTQNRRSWLRGPVRRNDPWVLRPVVGGAVTMTMLGLGLWLALQVPDGGWAGLAERLTAGAEALWPLIVVLALVHRSRRRRPTAGPGSGRHRSA